VASTKTRATELARNQVNASTHCAYRIFNDRLVNGARSVKVPGWSFLDYETLKQTCEEIGFEARIVNITHLHSAWLLTCGRHRYRIHILEK
jgi:hypothetical protein